MNLAIHDSSTVANAIIQDGERQGRVFGSLQLIKLTYLAHGWMLGLYGRPLIIKPVEAWRLGPVIRDLYAQVKQFKAAPITEMLDSPSERTLGDFESEHIQQVVITYGKYSGIALSQMTHAPGTPWSIIWEKHGKNAIIPNDLIQEHFHRLYRERTQRDA